MTYSLNLSSSTYLAPNGRDTSQVIYDHSPQKVFFVDIPIL